MLRKGRVGGVHADEEGSGSRHEAGGGSGDAAAQKWVTFLRLTPLPGIRFLKRLPYSVATGRRSTPRPGLIDWQLRRDLTPNDLNSSLKPSFRSFRRLRLFICPCLIPQICIVSRAKPFGLVICPAHSTLDTANSAGVVLPPQAAPLWSLQICYASRRPIRLTFVSALTRKFCKPGY